MTTRSVVELLREAVAARDIGPAAHLLADDVVLYGSLTHRPFEGKDTAMMIFNMLLQLCEDIEYIAEYTAEGGVAVLLKGKLGDRQFEGAQFITFNADGLIVEFHDLIRPISALTVLQEKAAAYLAGAAST